MKLKSVSKDVARFLERQHHVVVSTIDGRGRIHCSAKGVVKVDERGVVFLVDVYRGQTRRNLMRRANMTVTAIDEHHFIGYSLKGEGTIVGKRTVEKHLLRKWEERIVSRIAARLIRNLQNNASRAAVHPEARLPGLRHLIVMHVSSVVDLTPGHLRRKT